MSQDPPVASSYDDLAKELQGYMELKEENARLMEENAKMREELSSLKTTVSAVVARGIDVKAEYNSAKRSSSIRPMG